MKIKKNGKVVNLTESDLQRIVKRTLNEGVVDSSVEGSPNKSEGKSKKQQYESRQKITVADFMLRQPKDDITVVEGGLYPIQGKLIVFTKLDGAFELS
jgi:hypothetical protein